MLMHVLMFSQFTLAFLQTALFGLDLLFNNQKKKNPHHCSGIKLCLAFQQHKLYITWEYTARRCGVYCCIRCGPDEERILEAVPREDGACNSG